MCSLWKKSSLTVEPCQCTKEHMPTRSHFIVQCVEGTLLRVEHCQCTKEHRLVKSHFIVRCAERSSLTTQSCQHITECMLVKSHFNAQCVTRHLNTAKHCCNINRGMMARSRMRCVWKEVRSSPNPVSAPNKAHRLEAHQCNTCGKAFITAWTIGVLQKTVYKIVMQQVCQVQFSEVSFKIRKRSAITCQSPATDRNWN